MLTSQIVLDFVSVGSAFATTLHRLKPVFLAVTVITLANAFWRGGFSRRNLLRCTISLGLLLVPRVLELVSLEEGGSTQTGSCH